MTMVRSQIGPHEGGLQGRGRRRSPAQARSGGVLRKTMRQDGRQQQTPRCPPRSRTFRAGGAAVGVGARRAEVSRSPDGW
ncbi:hypothetical protein QJS66_05940 [Kocuria rhizophila]|nr:hypothetical protein QJS66_05940 [Kocuria rhizophila]